eukprot:g16.t1
MSYGFQSERASYGCGCGPGLCLPGNLCNAFQRDNVEFGKVLIMYNNNVPQDCSGNDLSFNAVNVADALIDGKNQPLLSNDIKWVIAYPCCCPKFANLCCCCGTSSMILKNIAYSAIGLWPKFNVETRLDQAGFTDVVTNNKSTVLTSSSQEYEYFGLLANEMTSISFTANLANNNIGSGPESNSTFRLWIWDKPYYCNFYPLASYGQTAPGGTFGDYYAFDSSNGDLRCMFQFILSDDNTYINIAFYSKVTISPTTGRAVSAFTLPNTVIAEDDQQPWLPTTSSTLTQNFYTQQHCDNNTITLICQLLRENYFSTLCNTYTDLFLWTLDQCSTAAVALLPLKPVPGTDDPVKNDYALAITSGHGQVIPWFCDGRAGKRMYAGINAGYGAASFDCCEGQVEAVVSESEETKPLWYLGMIFFSLGATGSNVGLNIQKYALQKETQLGIGGRPESIGDTSSRLKEKKKRSNCREFEFFLIRTRLRHLLFFFMGESIYSDDGQRTNQEHQSSINHGDELSSTTSLSSSNPGSGIGNRSLLWVLGVLVWLMSSMMIPVGLSYATQTQLAPLLGLGILSNMVSAHLINNEHIARTDYIALSLMLMGMLFTTSSAPHVNEERDSAYIAMLMEQPPFLIFLTIVVILVGCLFYAKVYMEKQMKRIQSLENTNQHHYSRNDHASDEVRKVHLIKLFSITCGALTGTLNGFSQSLTKSIIDVVFAHIASDGIYALLSRGVLWILLLGSLLAYVSSIYMLTSSLKQCRMKIVVTTDNILAQIISMLSGLLFFQEYVQFSLITCSLFATGVLLSLGGLTLLMLGRGRKHVKANSGDVSGFRSDGHEDIRGSTFVQGEMQRRVIKHKTKQSDIELIA